jgi:iron(III) transport system substrate-binding protein
LATVSAQARCPLYGIPSSVRIAVAVTGCATIALSACSSAKSGTSAGAATPVAQGKDLAAVCQAAESEGKVTFRDTTDPEIFKKEVSAFETKYPKIKVDFGSQRPQDSVQRIVAEKQAKHAVDVDAIAIDMPSAAPMIEQNLIQPVDWTALGVPAGDILTRQGAQFVRTQRIVLGLGYNTTKLKASDLPNTWEELINSKWSGKVIVDPRGEYLSGVGIVWGQDKAVDWYKRLMSTDKPMVVKGATTSLEKVISGEALLTTSSHDAEVLEQQSKGAPVAIKYLDVVPTQDHYAIVAKGAAHPNAAACFLGWWVSPSGGQAAQLKYEFKGNEDEPSTVPATAKLGAITSAEQADIQAAVATQFAKLSK